MVNPDAIRYDDAEMNRFTSLPLVPSETRATLRRRLPRFVPTIRHRSHREDRPTMLPDEDMLALLANVDITCASDKETARATYGHLAADMNLPTFDSLVGDGWFVPALGRMQASMHVSAAAERQTLNPALAAFMPARFKETIVVDRVPGTNPAVAEIATRLASGVIDWREVGCRTPSWVACRLWETRPTDLPGFAVLRWWLDRWDILGAPALLIGEAWDASDSRTFREFAIGALRAEPGLGDWSTVHVAVANEIAAANGLSRAAANIAIAVAPAEIVARAGWLVDPSVETAVDGVVDALGQPAALLSLLLDEVEAADHARAPHPTMRDLSALAANRPFLLAMLIKDVRLRPRLLADLMLDGPMAALACRVLVDYPTSNGSFDRRLEERDDRELRGMAIADGFSVLRHGLALGETSPAEGAAFIAYLYARPRRRRQDGPALNVAAAAKDMVADLPPHTTTDIANRLIHAARGTGPDDPTFLAALDLVAAAGIAGEVDGDPLLAAYVSAISAGAYSLEGGRIQPAAALALLDLSSGSVAFRRSTILSPVDFARTLPGVEADGLDNRGRLIRSARAVIRLLSRVVVVLGQDTPDDVVDALAAMVESGSRDDAAIHRVDAFSQEAVGMHFGAEPRSITADLGAALTTLDAQRRPKLRDALRQIAEPVALAQLVEAVPASERPFLREQAAKCDPDSAPAVHSLTAVQARVDALLRAGLPDAAATFLQQEAELKTRGDVADRDRVRFVNTLRLQFARGDWPAIYATQVPPGLPDFRRREWQASADFYRGLTQLRDPSAPPGAAAATFGSLLGRFPNETAYILNLQAARLREFIGDDSFAIVPIGKRAEGRRILAETEASLATGVPLSAEDRGILDANAGMLLLAIGEPVEAAGRLATVQTAHGDGMAAALLAVSLDRSGREEQAQGVLDEAERVFGTATQALAAARAVISGGAPSFAGGPFAIGSQDEISRIRGALAELRELSSARQAAVLSTVRDRPLAEYLTKQVRAASAGVTNLVPAMTEIKLRIGEDDLTLLLRELLAARLQLVGWSIPDQSKGGFTAAGNAGERDLIVQWGNTVLTVIEAVKANGYTPHAELRSHFQKLFAYAECQVYFHITYATVPDLKGLLDALRKIAIEDAPPGYVHRQIHELKPNGDEPRGWLATYEVDDDTIDVVFLVLDLGRDRMRQAAKTSVSGKAGNGAPQ
jgi:hypothetical protein